MTVLVVDDDPVCTKALLLLLHQVSPTTRVRTVCTGTQALDLLEQSHLDHDPIDLCFMDVHLNADETGHDVVALLRACESAAPLLSRTTVVGVSGDAASRARCLSAGMDDFFEKPATPEKVRRCFAKASHRPTLTRPSPRA